MTLLPAQDRLVWVDCEMSGLDQRTDVLLEIAALVTDGELRPLDDGIEVVIGAPDEILAGMVDVVTQMHEASGLTDHVRRSTVTVEQAERTVLDYVRGHVAEARTAPLCGNSIATDRSFIARDMPELDAYLHYRMIDVSTVKELCRRWYPPTYYGQPQKGMRHRARADVLESIRELRYYRATVLVEPPGPSLVRARAAAASLA